MSAPDLLPQAEAIVDYLAVPLGTRPVVQGPERMTQYKLRQLARLSGGMLAVPLYNLEGEDEKEMGWMAVGIRMAVAIGGLMVSDPEVREKVGFNQADDLLMDAAQEILNTVTEGFNQELETLASHQGIRIGTLVKVAPADVEEGILQAGTGGVAGVYTIDFPKHDFPSLTRRRGSLAIAFLRNWDQPEGRPRIGTPPEGDGHPGGGGRR